MKNQKVTLRVAYEIAALIGMATWLAACAPVFSDLQSARLVGPGKIEATPGFSSVSVTDEGETEHIQNHFGIQAGFGVLSFLDFRLRYERVVVDGNGYDSFGLNVFGFGPKIGLLKDRMRSMFQWGLPSAKTSKFPRPGKSTPPLLSRSQSTRALNLTLRQRS